MKEHRGISLNCTICGRLLEQASDPLSSSCGGDCWGCVGDIEAAQGHKPSLEKVREEFALGLRPDWTDPSVPVRSVNSALEDLASLSGQNIAVEGILSFELKTATLNHLQQPGEDGFHSRSSLPSSIRLTGRAGAVWVTQAAIEGQGKKVTVFGTLRGRLHDRQGGIHSSPAEMLVRRIQWH